MSNVAIRVENLGKQFQIGASQAPYRTLRESINEIVSAPFRRVANVLRGNGYGASELNETIWALSDVSFEVKHGEVLGIIGHNGAGKSTLLKILSRITEPSKGFVDIYGRVGALLEVGTGFHPELTGRENVYLNAAILGMKRAEINRKFDEIVAFAEVEKFIDTPVKHYSSGMGLRLGFAVAAHLEPEILIVDEVLAVGDAAFQKKCLGKMSDVAGEGRTVLFVSHNMGAVESLCNRAILIKKGNVVFDGDTSHTIVEYLKINRQYDKLSDIKFFGPLADIIQFEKMQINGGSSQLDCIVSPLNPIEISVQGNSNQSLAVFRAAMGIFRDGVRVLTIHDSPQPCLLPQGKFSSHFTIPSYLLRPGDYSIAIGGYVDNGVDYFWGTDVALFTVTEEWDEYYDSQSIGLINVKNHGTRTTNSSPSTQSVLNAG